MARVGGLSQKWHQGRIRTAPVAAGLWPSPPGGAATGGEGRQSHVRRRLGQAPRSDLYPTPWLSPLYHSPTAAGKGRGRKRFLRAAAKAAAQTPMALLLPGPRSGGGEGAGREKGESEDVAAGGEGARRQISFGKLHPFLPTAARVSRCGGGRVGPGGTRDYSTHGFLGRAGQFRAGANS